MAIAEQFAELFTGGSQAYGEWHGEKGGVTRHEAPTLANYLAHLEGTVGLGIVPIQKSGLCRFAAIDIDINTIDHQELYRKIVQRKMPLTVCRSKSGGAHLYLFMREPGLAAATIQPLLKRWAMLLGYPQAEVFPKQVRTGSDNVGSWINLPYFGGDATTRYAVGPEGAIGLEDFLKSVKFYDPNAQVDESVDEARAVMPPCLAAITQNGVQQGQRNQVMFNLAVFYRKASPANWETRLSEHNSQYFAPPLDYRELQGVVKSANRTKYQYTCNQSPLIDCCNRAECVKLPFGVNHMPWEEHGAYDDLVVGNCRKLLTDPPRYIVEVNGRDITLVWDELFNFKTFRSKVGQVLDAIVAGLKQPQWEQKVRELLAHKQDIEAPEDASYEGLIIDKFHEFLVMRERAQQREDLLRGIPVQDGGAVLFRVGDFRRYLQGFKLDKVELSELFLALRKDGCVHRRIRLNGKLTTVWAYPLEKVNEQASEFAPADFSRDLEEDM